MSFFSWIWSVTSNVGLVVRQGHSHGKAAFLLTYLKVELTRFFVAGLLKRKITRERIFGRDIHFFDYETFATLFEEVYVADVYYFASVSPDPVIVDCGSNIGIAIFYFKKLYPDSTVLAFEPDPNTFAMLERNVKTAGFSNTTVVNKALSNATGSISFYVDGMRPGSLVQSTRRESLSQADVQLVEADLLSEYLSGPVDLLKMDIEGSEQEVFEDLAKSGKLSLVREIVMEYHHHMTRARIDWARS